MKKLFGICLMGVFSLWLTGCAGTLPTNSYEPQNFIRTSGEIEVGKFKYLPFENGKTKKPNQIQNSAIGSIYISTNVADFVQRGTALELEKSGILLNANSPYRLEADIILLKAEDIGYSVNWEYSIKYKIVKKSDGTVTYERICTPSVKKTGKFGLAMDYAQTINEIILSGYDIFIRDEKAISYLQEQIKK